VLGREHEADGVDETVVFDPRQPDALRAKTVPAFAEKRCAPLPVREILAPFEPDDRTPSEVDDAV
jgi:hypothetical protein